MWVLFKTCILYMKTFIFDPKEDNFGVGGSWLYSVIIASMLPVKSKQMLIYC